MKNKVLSISIVLVLILTSPINAIEFVVNQKARNANDAGPGTKKEPFKTIGAAVNKLKPGDKVLIYAGIYREGVELKTSGEEGKPITIEAASPGKVIMKGSVVVKDWKPEAGKSGLYIHDGWTKYFGPQLQKGKDARAKPRNQLFSDGTLIEEVFQIENLKENSFFIDHEKQQIHLWLLKDEDPNRKMIEVSDRESLLIALKMDYVVLRGMQFEHGACLPQQSLVRFTGNNCLVEDCSMSWAATVGFTLTGKNNIVRRCIFNHNGQEGFTAYYTADCRFEDCESSYNNIHPNKAFDINWEAGGNKIAFSSRLVIERHKAHFNNGDGIWFDTSNNGCEINNCLCTNNKRSGIFWEISYTTHIHDNVLMGNNAQGILLAESNGPEVERNIMIGNMNGLTFRDMLRTTFAILDVALTPTTNGGLLWRGKQEAIWPHNYVVKNNIIAYNKNSQVRGAFLNKIQRMVPAALQVKQPNSQRIDSMVLAAQDYQAKDDKGQPLGLSLEKLNIKVDNNVYWGDSIPTLFQWPEMKYQSLEQVRKDLKFEANGQIFDPQFADWKKLDLRVPKDSPLLKLGCYPQGNIPGVKLGAIGK